MYHETELWSLKHKQTTNNKNSFQAPRRISYLLPKGNTIYFLHYGKKIYLFRTVPWSILSLESLLPVIAKLHRCGSTWISCAYKWIRFPCWWLG